MVSSLSKTTQDFVPIKEVRDGIIVLKSGGIRAVLLASSLNFALKSEDNQQAIISQFQNFLNSLDFSVQIFMESRKLDIRPYIALLEERHKEQVSDLMRVQTREYIEFVKNFTESSNIMTKSFFVVVPYSRSTLPQGGPLGKMIRNLSGRGGMEEKSGTAIDNFEESRAQLEERLAVIEQGLVRCGIRVVQLGTEEVVELFYKIFNPGETEKPIQVS